jgi:hypothetical protein
MTTAALKSSLTEGVRANDLKLNMFDDNDILPWKPFGLKLTYREWDDLVTWYVQKNISRILDTKEDQDNALELHP